MHTFLILPARPRGRTLPARTAWLLYAFFSAFVVHLFFALSFVSLLLIYRCILFWCIFFSLSFWFCRPRSGRLHPREAAGEKPGDPHKQRLCEGFIFLKIFLKSSQVFFILFFILYVFQHIIYVQENVRRIRRRTLFPLYFLYSVVETAAALQA